MSTISICVKCLCVQCTMVFVLLTQAAANVIFFLAVSNVELLNLLQAKLFSRKEFSAPLSAVGTSRLLYVGVVGLMLEDLPQFILQAITLSGDTAPSNSVYGVSLAITSLSLAFSGIKYMANFFLARAMTKFGTAATGASNGAVKTAQQAHDINLEQIHGDMGITSKGEVGGSPISADLLEIQQSVSPTSADRVVV